MRRLPSSWLVTSFALAAACGNADDKAADAPAEAAPAVEADPAWPMAIVTVIYWQPKDTAAFEKYYAETHVPLVGAGQQEIGFTKAELTKFESNLDGSDPALYRQAEPYFPSMAALEKGTATPAFPTSPPAGSTAWSRWKQGREQMAELALGVTLSEAKGPMRTWPRSLRSG